MEIDFQIEVDSAVKALREGKTILYPTDTIWGLGCDATNADAVQTIYRMKEREESKSMIVLMADERDVLHYVAAPDLAVFDFLEQQSRPTTVIFDGAVNLPDNLVAADGSIAIRLVQDEFCRHLVKRLQKPIVSTSANISGRPSPAFFNQVSKEIKHRVHHIVRWRQTDVNPAQPSQIIKWKGDGEYEVLRK